MEAHEGRLVEGEGVALDAAQQKARRSRNLAIALALVAFVLVFYVGSIVKLGTAVEQANESLLPGGPAPAALTEGS